MRCTMWCRRGLARSLAIVCLIALPVPTLAHHSHGNYVDTFSDIEGTVKEMHLVTPHSWIYLEVKGADGQTHVWALEANSRAGLERIGVTREYVKIGDTVKVRCHP